MKTSSLYDGTWNLRNMIESVGKPPVWTFCGIVLLFGLVLGPGLLVLTGWVGRRSLMIFLVPAISLVTTALIVSYEVLHEGFGTTVRATSLLQIDEQTGSGFVWSRQTYFSGWPPREGQVFPNEVFFRPVVDSIPHNNYYRGQSLPYSRHPRDTNQQNIDYGAQQTTLTGAIRSRQQQQFLIGHPIKAKAPIAVTKGGSQSLVITNTTTHDLPFVILRDSEKGYYLGEDLAAGQSLTLQKQHFGELAGTLSRIRADHVPSLPEGLRAIGWANDNNTGQDVIDVAWLKQLSEQAELSELEPYGFITLQPYLSEIYMPVQGEIVESQTLTIGRLVW